MSENESVIQAEAVAQEPERKNLPAIKMGNRGVMLTSIEEVYRLAKYIFHSEFAPKNSTPEAITVRILKGLELGMPIMSAVQNIAVINGRPCLWGDVMLGLVRNSGLLSEFSEVEIGKRGEDSWGFRCVSKRTDNNAVSYEFTVADAKDASLWKKVGPWTQYPKRMLQMRARGFALRDLYPDVLMGTYSREEIAGGARDFIDVETDEPKPASIAELTARDAGNEPIKFPDPKKAEPEAKAAPAPVAKEPNPVFASLRKLMDISHISEAEAVEYAKSCLAAKDDASVTHIEEIDADVAARWVASWSVVMSAIKLFSRGGK